MAPNKTAGGQGPSEKFLKKTIAAKGFGAESAPGHKEAVVPGEAPVASDSGLPITETSLEEEISGTGSLPTTNDVGDTGLKPAQPGSAAPGPDLASE
ncbi:hypothetical protein SLS53_008875 [Cytospora paraplurivora]|uniref:Uncharacterized protein n=1 Tax=Cytospora paraplurivora TaxID=2898453 RepID=A0AAN9YBQ9_9PEZI